VKGEIILTKSLQEFKDVDKNALMAQQFSLDNVEESPQTLASFFILTHAVSDITHLQPFHSSTNMRLVLNNQTLILVDVRT